MAYFGVYLNSNIFGWNKIVLSLCIILSTIYLFAFLKRVYIRWVYMKHLPGKKTFFLDLLGNFSDIAIFRNNRSGINFNARFLQLICAHSQLFQNERFFGFWMSFDLFVLITKAETAEALLSGTKLMQKAWSYEMLHPWLGTGLLTSFGRKWKSRRKLLTPSFHFEILKDFLPVFNEQSHRLVKRFEKDISAEFTDIVTPVTLCSLDIICETTLGVKINAQENSESQYVKSVNRITDIIFERMTNPLLYNDLIFRFSNKGRETNKHIQILHNFTRTVIQEKKRHLLSGDPELINSRTRKALMDLLLDHHMSVQDLSEEDIREEVDTFAFEGHDTTSMGMSWCLYLIGLYPEIQMKIHDELYQIFGEDTERDTTTEDLKDMNYLERVLKESQRLYPSVPMIGRQVTENVNFCGYTLPKGATCTVLTYQLHRDPKSFPNPEVFDPDRFLPEISAKRNPFAYVPFSAGPRNCIGQRFAMMEEKVVVSTILRNFILKSLDERDAIVPNPELILRASVPLRVQFRPRREILLSA